MVLNIKNRMSEPSSLCPDAQEKGMKPSILHYPVMDKIAFSRI